MEDSRLVVGPDWHWAHDCDSGMHLFNINEEIDVADDPLPRCCGRRGRTPPCGPVADGLDRQEAEEEAMS